MNRTLTLIFLSYSLFPIASWADPSFADGMKQKSSAHLIQAEETFSQLVQHHPQDVDALEQLAIVQSWQQKFDASILSWEKVIRVKPEIGRLQVGLARVLYWKGNLTEATQTLLPALKTESENEDALVLAGDLMMASKEIAKAQGYYQKALHLDPKNTDIQTKLDRAVLPLNWRVDVGYTIDTYTNFRGKEDGGFLQLGYHWYEKVNLWTRWDNQYSFLKDDKSYSFGAAGKVIPELLVMGEFTTTPNRQIRPASIINLNFEGYFFPNATLLLGFRKMSYAALGSVAIYQPGLRLSFPDAWHLEIKDGISNNTDSTITSTIQFKLDHLFTEHLAAYVALASGEEDLPPQAVATTSYYTFGVSWDSRRWGARVDCTHEDRVNIYSHNSYSSTVNFKF